MTSSAAVHVQQEARRSHALQGTALASNIETSSGGFYNVATLQFFFLLFVVVGFFSPGSHVLLHNNQ